MLSFPVVDEREAERLITPGSTGHSDHQILLGEFPKVSLIVNLGQDTAAGAGKSHKFANTGDHRLWGGTTRKIHPLHMSVLHEYGVHHVGA